MKINFAKLVVDNALCKEIVKIVATGIQSLLCQIQININIQFTVYVTKWAN